MAETQTAPNFNHGTVIPGEVVKTPGEGPLDIPRSELRSLIEDYNTRHPSALNRTDLASLERTVLTERGRGLQNHLDGLADMPDEDKNKIRSYIAELENAVEDNTKWGEVYDYLERDLDDRRDELAAQARADINKVFRTRGHKESYTQAQKAYDESLRTYTRWDTVHLEEIKHDLENLEAAASDADKQDPNSAYNQQKKTLEKQYTDSKLERATEIATDEIRLLREAVSVNEPEEGKGRLRSKMREWADKQYNFGEKKFGKNKGEKRQISLGAIGLFVSSGLASGAVRGFLGVSGVATGGLTIGIAGATGAVIGGLKSTYVANRVKSDLGIAADNEKEDMQRGVSVSAGKEVTADQLVSPYLVAEKDKARKGRGLGRAAMHGAGIGLVSGVAGSSVGWFVGALPDLVDKIPDSVKGLFNRRVDVLSGGMGSEDANAETDTGNTGETQADSGGFAGVFDDIKEKWDEITDSAENNDAEANADDAAVEAGDGPPPQEETAPIDELLAQYAENPVTIEEGEGPYATMEKLGITDPDMKEALYNNPDVKAALMERGLIYDVGDGSGDWGWSTTGELSAEDVRSIFENANLDSVSAPEVDIPASYDADLRAVAEEYPIVTEIEPGMGGYELMKELNLPPEAWNDIKLSEGSDFYRMDDGHMGLRHTGALSPEGLRELMTALENNGHPLYVTAA